MANESARVRLRGGADRLVIQVGTLPEVPWVEA